MSLEDDILAQLERNVASACAYASQKVQEALDGHRVTGNLQESLQVKLDGLDGIVGTDNPAAAPLEYGTTHQAAQPFFRATLDAAKDKIAAILEEGF